MGGCSSLDGSATGHGADIGRYRASNSRQSAEGEATLGFDHRARQPAATSISRAQFNEAPHRSIPASRPQPGGLGTPPACSAESVIVIDARTGGILSARAMTQRRAVASTQKLLTALLVVERGDLDRRITVAVTDTRVEPSKLYVSAGQSYTRRQLLEALLIKSSNDVAKVLARDHSGSSEAFGRAMTQRARELGALNSVFKNPHGLTQNGQYSTAQDMARIAYHAYQNRTIRDIVARKSCVFRYASGKTKMLENTNKVLKEMPACTGMKTGYTHAAGRCLVSSASWRGREVILVQLGSKSQYIWEDARKLMGWALGMRS
jgi:D-alanyl-D-alanine carboxypeptidase (penicillin-binding protein 5/6)